MFVYKHSETTEYVNNSSTFYEIYKLYGQMTQEFLGLRIFFIGLRIFRILFLYEHKHIERFLNQH